MTAVRREPPEIAAWQAGVFTRAQALAEGWTSRQVHLLTGRGDWSRAAGIALIATARRPDGPPTGGSPSSRLWVPLTAEQLAWSAALTWPWGVLSHLTAACLHGFPVPDHPVGQVIGSTGIRQAYRLRAYEARLSDDETTTWGGLALTTPARSAIDCLSVLPADDGLDLWAWLSTRRIVTRSQLARAADQRCGRRGTPRLVRLLRLTRTGAVSKAELTLHGMLRKAGIRGWRAGAEVCDGEGVIGVVDLLFEREKVVIEVDGWRAHTSREAFVRDRRRGNRLEALGYEVLRFTWDDLVDRPDDTVRRIETALARGRNARDHR